jgi:cytochrome c oxidase subunit 1
VKLTTPMLMALSFVGMFTIGGLSGVMHASPPVDTQHQDTYFVVAHFHCVLFGGSIFGLFGGIYYWWPKVTGHMLNDAIGKIQWALFLIGSNLTFGPMHFLGVDGIPRRIYTYSPEMGWNLWNLIATIGAYVLSLGVIVFIVNVIVSSRGPKAGNDPWDAMTLEWTIPSPPPHYNYATIPMVHSRDAYWVQKHPEFEGQEQASDAAQVTLAAQPVAQADIPDGQEPNHEAGHDAVHMPDPSYWPVVAAFGLFIAGLGVLLGGGLGDIVFDPLIIADYVQGAGYFVVTGVGLFILLVGIYGWSLEPVNG